MPFTIEEIIDETKIRFINAHAGYAHPKHKRMLRRLVRRAILRAGFTPEQIPEAYQKKDQTTAKTKTGAR